MKKLVSILLCMALLCSLVVVTASAADVNAAEIEAITIPAGGSGVISVALDDNPGLAALRVRIVDDDGIGAIYNFTKSADFSLDMTPGKVEGTNIQNGYYFFVAAENTYASEVGTLTLSIPADVEVGDYTFSVVLDAAANDDLEAVDVEGTTFTVTVVEPEITEVNVMIDSGVNIGVFTNGPIDLVALDKANGAYALFTAADYEETEDGDGYVCYINVNPWSMHVDYIIDFASNFTFVGTDLDMTKLTEKQEASAIGILSYAKQVIGDDDTLDQLLADLLEFGRQAQIFQGADTPSYELPEGLEATELTGAEEFGSSCSTDKNIKAQNIVKKNATAAGKFKFKDATIEFGTRFVVTFEIERLEGISVEYTKARVQIKDAAATAWSSLNSDHEFIYAFSPAEYNGVEFNLWTNGTTKGSKSGGIYGNHAYSNTYGPKNYAAYLYDKYGTEDSDVAALIAVLEAYCNYCASVVAYE